MAEKISKVEKDKKHRLIVATLLLRLGNRLWIERVQSKRKCKLEVPISTHTGDDPSSHQKGPKKAEGRESMEPQKRPGAKPD